MYSWPVVPSRNCSRHFLPCTCTLYFRRHRVRTNGTHVHAFASSGQWGLQEAATWTSSRMKADYQQMLPGYFFQLPRMHSNSFPRTRSYSRLAQFNFPGRTFDSLCSTYLSQTRLLLSDVYMSYSVVLENFQVRGILAWYKKIEYVI